MISARLRVRELLRLESELLLALVGRLAEWVRGAALSSAAAAPVELVFLPAR